MSNFLQISETPFHLQKFSRRILPDAGFNLARRNRVTPSLFEFDHQGKTHILSVSITITTFNSMVDAQPAPFTQFSRGPAYNPTYAQAVRPSQTDTPSHLAMEDRLQSMQQEVIKAVRETLTEETNFTDADGGSITMKDGLCNIQRSQMEGRSIRDEMHKEMFYQTKLQKKMYDVQDAQSSQLCQISTQVTEFLDAQQEKARETRNSMDRRCAERDARSDICCQQMPPDWINPPSRNTYPTDRVRIDGRRAQLDMEHAVEIEKLGRSKSMSVKRARMPVMLDAIPLMLDILMPKFMPCCTCRPNPILNHGPEIITSRTCMYEHVLDAKPLTMSRQNVIPVNETAMPSTADSSLPPLTAKSGLPCRIPTHRSIATNGGPFGTNTLKKNSIVHRNSVGLAMT